MTTTLNALPEPTEEQARAIDAMTATLNGSGRKRVSIGGYAGTGKTTIIKHVLERLPEYPGPIVSAFTGKAVNVLQSKNVPAQTLHSLMYFPETGPNGKVEFVKKEALPCSSVIVDEASMVNLGLLEDLLSYGVPVAFVGDHGQLEPVGDDPGIMKRPDVTLEQIHRQAAGNPILDFAHACRTGKPYTGPGLDGGDDRLRFVPRGVALEDITQYDMMLCGFNQTRTGLNGLARFQLDLNEAIEPGEKMICLKNDKTLGVFNGMTFTVKEVLHVRPRDYFDVTIILDDGREMPNVRLKLVNGKTKGIAFEDPGTLVADYGYAMTVHKAQGSEAPSVLVIEEIWTDKWNPNRWKYTAATRAAENLTWVRKG